MNGSFLVHNFIQFVRVQSPAYQIVPIRRKAGPVEFCGLTYSILCYRRRRRKSELLTINAKHSTSGMEKALLVFFWL